MRGIYGIVVARLSSTMGIGSGSLGVPLLNYHFPIRGAVGTAAAVGLGHPDLPPFSFGYVNLLAFAGFLIFNAVNMLITAFH